MKEIDYILKNIDVQNFLKLIRKVDGTDIREEKQLSKVNIKIKCIGSSDDFLIHEITESVKNPSDDLGYLLEMLVSSGIFFQKVKGLSLIYKGEIYSPPDKELGGVEVKVDIDTIFSIICFFSNIDKKYILLLFHPESHGNYEYVLVNEYDTKPTLTLIEDEFKEFLILLNTNAMYKWDISVRSYHDGKNILKIELDTDDKKYWSKKLNLERKS